jgi:hypothetical protein
LTSASNVSSVTATVVIGHLLRGLSARHRDRGDIAYRQGDQSPI